MLHMCVTIYSLNTTLPFLFLLVQQLLIFYSAQIENMHENRWMGTLLTFLFMPPAPCLILFTLHAFYISSCFIFRALPGPTLTVLMQDKSSVC